MVGGTGVDKSEGSVFNSNGLNDIVYQSSGLVTHYIFIMPIDQGQLKPLLSRVGCLPDAN